MLTRRQKTLVTQGIGLEIKFFIITFSVQSKRGTRAITRLHIDSSHSQDEVQQDLGVLAQQALPIEFRHVMEDIRNMFKIDNSDPGTVSSFRSCQG